MGAQLPPTPPPPAVLDLSGKSFVFGDLVIEWLDGTSEAEKTEMLDGETEEEYFEDVKAVLLSAKTT